MYRSTSNLLTLLDIFPDQRLDFVSQTDLIILILVKWNYRLTVDLPVAYSGDGGPIPTHILDSHRKPQGFKMQDANKVIDIRLTPRQA
jgi:hypothetical protein